MQPTVNAWRWWYGTSGMLLGLVGSYWWYAARQDAHGGSLMGVVYGATGALLLIALMLYGVRKRVYHCRLGSLHHWLTAHLCLGTLALAVVLCHSGFRFHDTVAVSALVLLGIVVGSGVLGLYLYRVIPVQLGTVERAFSLDQLTRQLRQLDDSMTRVAAEKSPAFQSLYRQLAYVSQPRFLSGWPSLTERRSVTRRSNSVEEAVYIAQTRVPAEEQADLHRLCTLAGQRREIHVQLVRMQRCKHLLEVWLYVHVPFSFALLLVVAIHIIAALYYSPLGAFL